MIHEPYDVDFKLRELDRQMDRLMHKAKTREHLQGRLGVYYREELNEELLRLEKSAEKCKAIEKDIYQKMNDLQGKITDDRLRSALSKERLRKAKEDFLAFINRTKADWEIHCQKLILAKVHRKAQEKIEHEKIQAQTVKILNDEKERYALMLAEAASMTGVPHNTPTPSFPIVDRKPSTVIAKVDLEAPASKKQTIKPRELVPTKPLLINVSRESDCEEEAREKRESPTYSTSAISSATERNLTESAVFPSEKKRRRFNMKKIIRKLKKKKGQVFKRRKRAKRQSMISQSDKTMADCSGEKLSVDRARVVRTEKEWARSEETSPAPFRSTIKLPQLSSVVNEANETQDELVHTNLANLPKVVIARQASGSPSKPASTDEFSLIKAIEVEKDTSSSSHAEQRAEPKPVHSDKPKSVQQAEQEKVIIKKSEPNTPTPFQPGQPKKTSPKISNPERNVAPSRASTGPIMEPLRRQNLVTNDPIIEPHGRQNLLTTDPDTDSVRKQNHIPYGLQLDSPSGPESDHQEVEQVSVTLDSPKNVQPKKKSVPSLFGGSLGLGGAPFSNAYFDSDQDVGDKMSPLNSENKAQNTVSEQDESDGFDYF